MPTVYDRKHSARVAIAGHIYLYLEENPHEAKRVANSAVRALAVRMTLAELESWQADLDLGRQLPRP